MREEKASIENLMYHQLKSNYKELCDKLKVAILDKLIDISLMKEKGKECITYFELELIRQGINDLRTKEKEAELNAIVSVIDNLLSRGDSSLSHNPNPLQDKTKEEK